jgi:peptidyl-prolyl cis-trans isomerase SurA
VEKGKAMGYEQRPSVIAEQKQYRQQLTNSFLTEREISDKLVKEAYERSKEDRSVSHIFVALSKNASPQEVAQATKKMEEIASKLSVQDFATLAAQYSEDLSSKNKGGNIGYFTVLQLPYALENAVYTTDKGKVSAGIVRSPYGLHLVKVEDIRPAMGKMQVAHLFLRKSDNAKARLDSAYNALKKGSKFTDLVLQMSEDNASKQQEGMLGWVGINDYDLDFEKQIFALAKDGDYSMPFESKAGWHILLRIKQFKNPTFNDAKAELKERILKDQRYQLVLDALVARIKQEGKYQENQELKAQLLAELSKDNSFITYAWKPTEAQLNDQAALFTLGNGSTKGSVQDFMRFAQQSAQERFGNQFGSVPLAFEVIFQKFVASKCLQFEETQLEQKYPEFRNLMREYEEGILLFETKRELIWDKAAADTAGLRQFYEANKAKYLWNQRAQVSFYTIRSTEAKTVKAIKKFAASKDADAVKAQFNKDNALVQVTTGTYEKGRNPEVDKMKWKKGFMSREIQKDGTTLFNKIENVLPKEQKNFNDARGYVVSDYQNKIEKDLLEVLRKEYKVQVDENVLKSIIKK